MVHQKQRPRLWRKQSDGDNTKEIGSPVLVETTLQKAFLDKLPNVNKTQHDVSPVVHSPSPRSADSPFDHKLMLDPKLMKALPTLVVEEPHDTETKTEYYDHRLRPISDVPTASSIYTRPSPEIPYEFDPESQVAPLFSGTSNQTLTSSSMSRALEQPNQDNREHDLEDSDNISDLAPIYADRARQEGASSLGIDTRFTYSYQSRALWQGASGQTAQLTPITATPVTQSIATQSVAGSVSPIDEQQDSNYFPYHPTDENPTPRAQEQPLKALVATPETPKFFPSGQATDNDSPYSQPSREDRQPHVSRFSWTTYATESDQPKPPAEVSTPQTNHSLNTWGTHTPPQYYFRNQQTWSPMTPDSKQGNAYNDSTYSPGDVETLGPSDSASQRASYGRAMTYPGIRYQTEHPAPSEHPTTIDSSPESKLNQKAKRLTPIMARNHPFASLPKPAKAPSETITNPKNKAKAVIKRKPAPSSTATDSKPPSQRSSSTPADTDKNLPHTPATLSSIDYITMLQSELATLSLQKHNLSKRIAHMNEVFAPKARPNPLIIDLQRRRETKEQVAQLELELANVQREEHDTGLRLMRAQRRRDQEAPSALWVRRVTSVSDASY